MINIPALVLLVITLIITYLLGLIFPAYLDLELPYFWMTLFIISGYAETTRLKPRLFLVPIWLISFIAFFWTSVNAIITHNSWNAPIVFILLIGIGVYIFRTINLKRFKQAEEILSKYLQSNVIELSTQEGLYVLEQAFFVPAVLIPDNNLQHAIFGRGYDYVYTRWFSQPNRNQHYLVILNHLEKYIPEAVFKAKVSVFRDKLQKLQKIKEDTIEDYMIENVEEILKNKTSPTS